MIMPLPHKYQIYCTPLPPTPCFGGHIIMQTAPQFSWDSSIGKFVGPAQKSNLEKAMAETARAEEEKQVKDLKHCMVLNVFPTTYMYMCTPLQAKLTRSKLLKTMAQQRLKVRGHH